MAKRTILIVDDNEINRKLLRVQLEAEGYATLQAGDGIEALELLARNKVDSVITDLLMPRMDGYRFCYKMRTNNRLKAIPVIIHSSTHTSPSDEHLAFEVGADKFIKRPAPAQLILDALQEVATKPRAHLRKRSPSLNEVEVMKEYSEALVKKLEEQHLELQVGNQNLLTTNKALQNEITERRSAEAALGKSEARKGAILESALDCIITMDHRGRIIEFNPAAEKTFGYNRTEVLGKEMSELIIPPSLREAHHRGLAHYLATGEAPVLGKRIEITAIRADATEFPVELSILRIPGFEPPMFTGFIRDITERKRAEEEIRRNLEHIRALHEIDLAISSTLNLRSILNILLEKIELFLPIAAATTVRLLNRKTGELESLACRGLDEEKWRSQQIVTPGGRAKTIVETRASLALRNIQSDLRTYNPEIFRERGLVSYLGVPLIAKDEVLGVLSLYTKQEHEFSKEEIEFLNTLAGQAAIAIHNAQVYEEMAKANKVKEEFLSVMSHELRTPLSVVMGYTGLIKEGTLGPVNEQQVEALQKVLGRAGDQLIMINEIMQATQLEAHAITVRRELFNLRGLLDQLRSDYEVQGEKKDVRLIWNYPAVPTEITTDGAKFKQILQNLINNGLKFTDEGSVTVSVRIAADESDPTFPTQTRFVEFTVADTGIGIPKEVQDSIFHKFHQLDSSETRLYGGVGLGLYIVKNFSDLLGGTIEVESTPGKGSTFTVRIPL